MSQVQRPQVILPSEDDRSQASPDFIFIQDFDRNIDPEFISEVANPYFKSLFGDIAMRSHTPKKSQTEKEFVDNCAFFEYTKLPGIICDRFLPPSSAPKKATFTRIAL